MLLSLLLLLLLLFVVRCSLFVASFEAQLQMMAWRLSHRVVAIGYIPTQQRKLASHPQYKQILPGSSVVERHSSTSFQRDFEGPRAPLLIPAQISGISGVSGISWDVNEYQLFPWRFELKPGVPLGSLN